MHKIDEFIIDYTDSIELHLPPIIRYFPKHIDPYNSYIYMQLWISTTPVLNGFNTRISASDDNIGDDEFGIVISVNPGVITDNVLLMPYGITPNNTIIDIQSKYSSSLKYVIFQIDTSCNTITDSTTGIKCINKANYTRLQNLSSDTICLAIGTNLTTLSTSAQLLGVSDYNGTIKSNNQDFAYYYGASPKASSSGYNIVFVDCDKLAQNPVSPGVHKPIDVDVLVYFGANKNNIHIGGYFIPKISMSIIGGVNEFHGTTGGSWNNESNARGAYVYINPDVKLSEFDGECVDIDMQGTAAVNNTFYGDLWIPEGCKLQAYDMYIDKSSSNGTNKPSVFVDQLDYCPNKNSTYNDIFKNCNLKFRTWCGTKITSFRDNNFSTNTYEYWE